MGDTIQSLSHDLGERKCVTVDPKTIPYMGGCPPKDTPLKFRDCEFSNAYQQWRMDAQKRIVLQPCPHLCMVEHSSGWVYARSRVFAWPCVGAAVPYSIHHVRHAAVEASAETGKEDSNAETKHAVSDDAGNG